MALGSRQAFAHDGFDRSRDNQWQPAFHRRRWHTRRGDRLPVQTEAEETIVVGHAPGILAITGTCPLTCWCPIPRIPHRCAFLAGARRPSPSRSRAERTQTARVPRRLLGLLKVSVKLGSSCSLVLIPMQYCPGARSAPIVPRKAVAIVQRCRRTATATTSAAF